MFQCGEISKVKLEEEPENNNPDRCDECKVRLTAVNKTETLKTESQSICRTARSRRNPSRSAKRNVLYRENEIKVDAPILQSIEQHCWKCSEVKTEPFKDETLSIDDQSESDSAGHHQSDVLETSSVEQGQPKCNVCDKTFTKRSNLDHHISTVHDKVKSFLCPHCPYKAAYSCSLRDHLLTHTGEKNFKCEICDKKFTLNGNLKHHIRTVHDKVRAFPCPHCPYKADHSMNLERHILTHTGEKDFNCDICDKKFARNSHLKHHIRTVHGKIRAFPCPHCPYKAGQSVNLERHILTHTGEKNFSCDICEKKFAQKGNLTLHIKAVHDKVKEFSCSQCPYKAAQSATLKQHIKTMHAMVL